MNRFLADIERRAFRIAWFATGNRDDALDLVQETMIRIVQKYRKRESTQWPAIFHTILQSRIRDWYRRRKVRARVLGWPNKDEDGADPEPASPAGSTRGPEELADGRQTLNAIESAIFALPQRQQQALLLRAWEGLNTAETARAMRISEGSVKTHYFRALQTLREQLKEHRHG